MLLQCNLVDYSKNHGQNITWNHEYKYGSVNEIKLFLTLHSQKYAITEVCLRIILILCVIEHKKADNKNDPRVENLYAICLYAFIRLILDNID